MNKKPALSVSLNTLLKQGLTVNDGPLWMQGDNVTTRREARLMVASAQSAFKASGMARGDRLALYGTPSPQSLAALLAALIDEIVIVPIDESLNLARKNQMLELAMPKAILNLSDADDFAPDLIQVTLEKSGDTLATNLSPLIDQSDPNAPCYIFFTSGSTGVPKPVLGRSSGLAHFIAWEKDCLNLSINDRVSLLTRFSFDVVLRDILLPLVSGCISVLPSNNKPMAAHSTMEWISEHGITVFHTVPSVANALLSATTNQSSTISLKHTLFAGEPLSGSLVERWRVRFPNSVVHNLYGPTETTLAKFHAEVPVPATAGIQCCGTALPETDVVILSEARVPTTFGEMGEVAISTPFASLGYATQTDDIIPIVSRIDGADWYLTGDVGFFDQDGDLHLRGRKDDQVKIMGVRLELAGVSALMEIHPLIEKAVVIAEEDEQGQKSLIAWYIAEPECTLTASDIRSFLADRSPPAGIPGHLISCDDFPVTPNGKIDKARLPRPNSSQDAYVVPATSDEAKIAAIFAQELGLDRVGATADFFSLGGDSLAATVISISLSDAFSCYVEPGMFLDTSTPRELAKALKNQSQERVQLIPPAPVMRTFPLTPQQQRYFRTFCASGNRNWCNMVALFSLPDNVTTFEASNAIADITLHHDSLRLAFEIDAHGQVIQSINPTSSIELGLVDLSKVKPAQLQGLLGELKIKEGEKPINVFSEAPLFRAKLVLLPGNKRMLLWNVHHLISDGTSQGILSKLLLTWFDDAQRFRQDFNDLPSFKDVAHFVDNVSGSEAPRIFPELLNTPVLYRHHYLPHLNDVVDSQRCNAFEAALSSKTVKLLKARARSLKCTPYVILLSGYFRFLGKMSKSDDIAIVTPLAGRAHPQMRDIIGDFINLVPLRIADLSVLDNRALVACVKEQVTEAARHQDDQFDQVIDALGLPFPSDRNALTGFSLNYMPQGNEGSASNRSHSDRGYKLKYDMLFLVRDFTNTLNIEIQYRTGIFNQTQIEAVFDEYERTMIGMSYDN